jgi:hypothetical protein
MLLGIIFIVIVGLMAIGAVMDAWYKADNAMKLNQELRAKRRQRRWLRFASRD